MTGRKALCAVCFLAALALAALPLALPAQMREQPVQGMARGMAAAFAPGSTGAFVRLTQGLLRFILYFWTGVLTMCGFLCVRLRFGPRLMLTGGLCLILIMADALAQSLRGENGAIVQNLIFSLTGAACGILVTWLVSLAVLYGRSAHKHRHPAARRRQGYAPAPQDLPPIR